jgi:ppGpp synthetase/RelA/SpoT-type nucleotidyltranferase
MNEAAYQKHTRPHARALRQLLLDFEFFFADAGNLNVFSITGRIKTYESAAEKERRIRVRIPEQQDLAGIRVVLATSAEIEVVAEFLRDEERREKLRIVSDKTIQKRDGYRSRHIILAVGPQISHSVYDATVEVQLNTILQHAYNFVSRAWVYKSERVLTPEWQARFAGVAVALAELDTRIGELHGDVLESAATGSDNEPLTPFSLQRIVSEMFGEEMPLDRAVWNTRFLIDLHVTTNGEAREFFRNSEILALRDRIRNLKDDRARSIMASVADMSMYSFFMGFGVRLEATHTLLDGLEERSVNDGGA